MVPSPGVDQASFLRFGDFRRLKHHFEDFQVLKGSPKAADVQAQKAASGIKGSLRVCGSFECYFEFFLALRG